MPTDLEWLNKIASNMYLKNEFSTKVDFLRNFPTKLAIGLYFIYVYQESRNSIGLGEVYQIMCCLN